jgi:hypothetical protein
MTDLQYIWEQITLFFTKGLVIVFAIMGLAGVAARMAFSPKTDYTPGQRIVMYFTGGIFSVLVGSTLLHTTLHPSFIALAGYFVGLLSNGFVVYTIDNEKSLFHKIFAVVHVFLDSIINKINPKKDGEKTSN